MTNVWKCAVCGAEYPSAKNIEDLLQEYRERSGELDATINDVEAVCRPCSEEVIRWMKKNRIGWDGKKLN